MKSARSLMWNALGGTALLLGGAGLVLPLLPTTPFVLFAAFAFSNGSPWLRERLLAHRTFGSMITAWEERGAIPRGAKIAACSMMAGLLSFSFLAGFALHVLLLQVAAVSGAAAFILTRPSP